MKKKNVLSLHEETEKEAAKIEKEILKDSKLEEIKVSDEMEKRLAEQIQAYEKTQSQKKKKVHRHSPLFRRRVMVAAAVLMIAAVATSVTAVGSKSYLKEIIEKFTGETGQASVINVEDMDTQASESADETQVYREIKREFGIQAVRIQYKPKGSPLFHTSYPVCRSDIRLQSVSQSFSLPDPDKTPTHPARSCLIFLSRNGMKKSVSYLDWMHRIWRKYVIRTAVSGRQIWKDFLKARFQSTVYWEILMVHCLDRDVWKKE